ncbi:MAG: hypothetical protein A2W01_08670 [Candidatus Solincola sediminis]|uniref:NADH-ubiquinone oxidoreductase 51kDa subunit iron-sulphur binding domain-containing protein n=1 Tax=Candidatus Solincola sediminis TaxID=1797199 RepID=A0A1F2WT11_9ACTN|nr:MAG: hypothetical protein A2Y75_07815 [Candidatus Solincola sediminis]OFW60204.1 MAG: hypothetical protein A2W01_08670 [Candidatus Solincola sediminis]
MPKPPQPEMMPLILAYLKDAGVPDGSVIENLAIRLKLPSSRIYGFISQFPEFAGEAGRMRVRVCSGPACVARGAGELFDALRKEMPPDALLVRDPGLMEWHDSPAVCIESPGREKVLIDSVDAEDLTAVLAAAERGDAVPSGPRIPIGADLPAWWVAEESREAAESHESAIREFARDPASAAKALADSWIARAAGVREIIAAASGRASGSPGPALMICDIPGREVENSIDYQAALLHPKGVVLGAALGILLSGAGKVVFYLPWNDKGLRKAITEAVEELLPGMGVSASVLEGPVHVPSSFEIGRAAIVQGRMLWEAASVYSRNGVGSGPESIAVLPAASAVRLSRNLDGGQSEQWITGVVDCAGNHSLLAVRNGFRLKDDAKAIQTGSRLISGVEAESNGLDETSQLVLLDSSQCMVQWAHYLATRAEDACCGGCGAGRTAPAVVAGLIEEVWAGKGDEKKLHQISSVLGSAGELALCPRLGQMLAPVFSTLNKFREEFETHALEGACQAGFSSTSARPQTEKG